MEKDMNVRTLVGHLPTQQHISRMIRVTRAKSTKVNQTYFSRILTLDIITLDTYGYRG